MSYLEKVLASTKGSRGRSEQFSSLLDDLMAQPAPAAQAPLVAGGSPSAVSAMPQGAPGGGSKGGNVDTWIKSALGVLKLDDSYIPGIRNMIMKESSGNPKAINNWDSNAKKGTPSKGIMQTIDSTFNAYKLPGYDDIYDPVSNIIAGVRYAQKRYGNEMLKTGGRRKADGSYKGY